MEWIEIVGLVAGICTSASLLPQLIKTFKTKKAGDVSVFMFIVMLAGNALWTFYGVTKSDLPIIATNIFALALNIVMLVLKFRFKNK
ncbi:MtN3 and saliva related transmembrane protein [Filimonas zeae]|uniref:MtN3 and saliva related transmembrane protein n=1 Tax=Filimonas zeae TaxID=1737353 RepID=A0A917IVQ5_9BACT|nr:SemiSWEET transporter [Filimonas zeae]MDR6339523.1 MtN3 and saliva related transmembrane protein [Filimonas zeae]GGH63223.1 hypothetical protein GCM10011379_13880 [Filimonas zeae]